MELNVSISASYLQGKTSQLAFEKEFVPNEAENKVAVENSVSDVILSISRENLKSSAADVSNLSSFANLLKDVKVSLASNPEKALGIQGNISTEAVISLI